MLRNMLLQAFRKNKFTLTMKLDWEKTGQHGNLYSWNSCVLPRVTSRDPSAVTLEQLLQIPGQIQEITEDMAMRTIDRDLYATNSSQDDTLDEIMSSPGKEKDKSSMPNAATTTDTIDVSTTGYASRVPAAPKYTQYKPKQVKYDPSGHSKSTPRTISQTQNSRYLQAQNAKKKRLGKKKTENGTNAPHKAQIQVRKKDQP
ncbi:hypothetical protein GCK32_005045 [Trichostrongylus colubriformis]|uniref:Uncharacterized protein n=1 Tax=Trichostrongylus colubriformis TaxID=6319 RepID=A0AAN8IDS9_TRICO